MGGFFSGTGLAACILLVDEAEADEMVEVRSFLAGAAVADSSEDTLRDGDVEELRDFCWSPPRGITGRTGTPPTGGLLLRDWLEDCVPGAARELPDLLVSEADPSPSLW